MKPPIVFLLLIALMLPAAATAGNNTCNVPDDLPLLPRPQHYCSGRGTLRLPPKAGNVWQLRPGRLLRITLLPPGQRPEGVPAGMEHEAYSLHITSRSIHITASTPTGVYRARQTLAQLARPGRRGRTVLPACRITDWPAFRIRGFMHDVGRAYIPIDELKREIDLLSQFKINVFHWHLTENQAWRLESKLYPALSSPANITRAPHRCYTQAEARELEAYCRERHVMLIPEIDMPGHSDAFRRAFGCDMQSENGMRILKQLIAEACQIFAHSPYLHIGTDEVQFHNPRFVPEMVQYVRSLGKRVISWNPGFTYRPGEIDMTQLWSSRGQAQPGIPAIDCRLHYVNHYDTFADLVALWASRIGGQDRGNTDMAGSILAVWNDRYIDNTPQILKENNFYPAMLALAERAWRGGGYGYFDGRTTLLWPEEADMVRQFGQFEDRLLWHLEHTLRHEPTAYVRQQQVEWRITDAFPNHGRTATAFPPETAPDTATHYVYDGHTYGSRTIRGAGIYLRHVWSPLVPGFYAHPEPEHTAYAMTWVYSPRTQPAGLRLEFQNYSRSESDLPPPPGQWDYKGSQAWLNGQLLTPPTWQNAHRSRSLDIPLRNENAASRQPIPVTLRKGWNKLLLKLPCGRFDASAETRLVKWMFSAVFVTPHDDTRALPGISYSATAPHTLEKNAPDTAP